MRLQNQTNTGIFAVRVPSAPRSLSSGVDLLQTWLDALDDRLTRACMLRRIDRLRRGSFGDCRFCAAAAWELRIDHGPGYRVYYARQGESSIVLLCGGSKRTQARDIAKAIACWKDVARRQR